MLIYNLIFNFNFLIYFIFLLFLFDLTPKTRLTAYRNHLVIQKSDH